MLQLLGNNPKWKDQNVTKRKPDSKRQGKEKQKTVPAKTQKQVKHWKNWKNTSKKTWTTEKKT